MKEDLLLLEKRTKLDDFHMRLEENVEEYKLFYLNNTSREKKHDDMTKEWTEIAQRKPFHKIQFLIKNVVFGQN